MKGDMAEGVAEIVFDEADLPHLRSIYPEITDYLTEKLQDPGWLSDLNERLEALAEAYETDNSLMRFHHYNPVNISRQFQKFADEVIPYQAREGFYMERTADVHYTRRDRRISCQRWGVFRRQTQDIFLLSAA